MQDLQNIHELKEYNLHIYIIDSADYQACINEMKELSHVNETVFYDYSIINNAGIDLENNTISKSAEELYNSFEESPNYPYNPYRGFAW